MPATPAAAFQELLHAAFRHDAARFLSEQDYAAYAAFEQARAADVAFCFERVRLLVAMSLLHALAELGDQDDARQVVQVLHRALKARSTADIDAVISKETKRFERLYTNLYVNEEGGQLLNLFEQTLDADSEEAMEDVVAEANDLVQDLDFSPLSDEDDEDDEE